MSPAKERKFLQGVLESLEKPVDLWSWRGFLLNTVAFAGIGIIVIVLIQMPVKPTWVVVILVVIAFCAGATIGCLNLWTSLYRRGVLIRPYIDKKLIDARLKELVA